MQKDRPFSPQLFLASTGAGGLSILSFALFQYTHHKGEGLIKLGDIAHASLPAWQQGLFYGLEASMAIFIALHALLSLYFMKGLIGWMRTGAHERMMADPLVSVGVLAPYISLFMTLNVVIGPMRFFVPSMADNLQGLMLPGLIGWLIPWVFLMITEVRVLRNSFEKSFDITKISFGWLLHPFALGMASVTGAGIAAMAKNPDIAHTAAFLSLISATMGVFLLVVKLTSVFTSHFAADGLPAKQFMPSFLVVVPNITLYAITANRLGHYLEHQHHVELGAYYPAVVALSYAFETWYLLFGVALLSDYFRKDFFQREFYVSQWGLVCPFVAYGTLSAFAYKIFLPVMPFYALSLVAGLVGVGIFALLLRRQLACLGLLKVRDLECT